MKTEILTLATLLCAAIASVQTAHPAIISVTNGNDSGAGSLRQALINANDGDTIQFTFTQGTQVSLFSGELVVDKSVVITSLNVTLPVTVTRMSAAPSFRIFHIAPGKTVSISGLIITNGVDSGAGGGGGIRNEKGTLTINNCVVSGNSSRGGGGGIYNDIVTPGGDATLTINNSTISGNTAPFGGGIGAGNSVQRTASESSTITINNSTISGNSATSNNNFGAYGGGIFNQTPTRLTRLTLTINNCTLSGNSATNNPNPLSAQGGGIYTRGANPVSRTVVSNSTLSGNSASGYGGGISGARFDIFNSTLSGNSASGGASLNCGSYSRIGNTILKSSGANINSHISSVGYNLCNDNGNGDLTAPGDQINTDPMLGPLQNNGGPTLTHAPSTGSPAIDRGNPHFTPPPNFDQRGTGFPRVVNGRLDIGAVEVQ